jgi:hypothetical protein
LLKLLRFVEFGAISIVNTTKIRTTDLTKRRETMVAYWACFASGFFISLMRVSSKTSITI